MQEKPDPPSAQRPVLRGYEQPAFKPFRFTFDRVIRFLLSAGVIAVAVWLFWYFSSLIIYLVFGLVAAYLLRPVVDRFQGVGLGRIPAIFSTFLLLVVFISILLTFLVPFLARQVRDLSQQVSRKSAIQITDFVSSSARGRSTLNAGDFILSLDGQVVHESDELQRLVGDKEMGDVVRLRVQDAEGQQRDVVITLGERVEVADVPEAALNGASDGQAIYALGLRVRAVLFSEVVSSIENRLNKVVPMREGVILDAITEVFETLFRADRITQLMGSVVVFFTDIFYAVIVIPFVAFFILKDGARIRQSLFRLVPNRYFEITLAITEKVETNIGRYFKALFLQSLSIATVSTLLLSIVGLDSALAVGIFAGLANTIPYFGPLMGFLAGALVGITQTGDFSLLPGIFVAMGLTQIADNVLFQPLIFSRAAQAHPLVILFVVLMGAQLGGIVGMLVAIPVTTIVRVTVQQILWSLHNYRILQATR